MVSPRALRRRSSETVGTIGTYHYDDEACSEMNAHAAGVVAHVADEVLTQGPAFLDVFLGALRAAVLDELAKREDVTRALAASRSRTLADDPPH